METLTNQSLGSWFTCSTLPPRLSVVAHPQPQRICDATKRSNKARDGSFVHYALGKVAQLHDVDALHYVPANTQTSSLRNLMKRAFQT